MTISAIDDVDRTYNYANLEYEHADDYRGAAVWLVLVAVAAILYHGITIFVRILYFTPQIENYFSGYSIVVSIWSVSVTTCMGMQCEHKFT